ncbi:hypothetical protein [Chlamydia caviae]|uniref:Uncharacterized protein n=1 Tax=Chlamydia caviae (strain ATCC VR-813 / DSM 19441 / 03DC25 / GPIC) TaxID=227941 RepID=Q823Y3_CHLCV|nr:hypothetical protein [Chlamydia caviae]AAP05021.1 hypothetical protein CCA_00270 [Chlamydia caviae GPIC]
MAGVSGIGGGGGPGKLPPHGNDDDKQSKSASFGGHDIVFGDGERSRSGSVSSEHSIEERTRTLMEEGFQVRTPEEVEETRRASISPEEASNPGFFSRIWSSVKGIFTGGKKSDRAQGPEISSPIIAGYKRHGVRLPDARAMQAHLQSQSLQEISASDVSEIGDLDSGDTDITDISDESSLQSIDLDTDDRAEASTSSGRGVGGLAARVRGLWDFATRQQETPVDGFTGMTFSELVDTVQLYDQMILDADNETERQELLKYRDMYQSYVNTMLGEGNTSPTDQFDVSASAGIPGASSRRYSDGVGEARFLDIDDDLSSVSESELLDAIESGEYADHVLEEISPEVRRVLDEANNLRLQFDMEVSASVTPSLRERIQFALVRLERGIIRILTLIRRNLVALARLVRRGLRSLGELVRRCCVRERGVYRFLGRDRAYAREAERFIQRHTNSENFYSPGTLTVPYEVVNAWVNGRPDVVYVSDVRGMFGHEVVRLHVDDREGTYEIIGSSWIPYESDGGDTPPPLPGNHPSLDYADINDDSEDLPTTGDRDAEPLYAQMRPRPRGRDEGPIYDVPSPQSRRPRAGDDRDTPPPLPGNHPGLDSTDLPTTGGRDPELLYAQMRRRPRGRDEGTIYDVPSSQNRRPGTGDARDSIYDTPRPVSDGIYDVPRSPSEDIYNVPRSGPQLFTVLPEDGYRLPNLSGSALGVTPGFGNGVGAASMAEEIDRFIEETHERRESAAAARRPLPPLPPLQTPPESPYGSNRMMRLLRLMNDRVQEYKERRKDKQ